MTLNPASDGSVMAAALEDVALLRRDLFLYGFSVLNEHGHRVDPNEMVFDPSGEPSALDSKGQLYRIGATLGG